MSNTFGSSVYTKEYTFPILFLNASLERAMTKVVSHQPLTAEARVPPPRVSARGICGGQSGSGVDFSLSSSVFPFQYHSTVSHLRGRTICPLEAAL
jgi:hypothetical protein